MSRVVLLGPQRFEPNVRDAMEALGLAGTSRGVAVVTAGWQEREAEIDELRDHLGCGTVNLELYRRYEETLQEDAELASALHQRQNRLKRIQNLYRLQLSYAMDAARALQRRLAGGEDADDHLRGAIRTVQSIDRRHLTRVRGVHADFDRRREPLARDAVRRRRDELAAILDGVDALLVAGGNVATLVYRMRLFGLRALLGDRPVIAWSAGAMAISERIVLFHDFPPQGAGNAEILDAGLGWHTRIVALPHAARRLDLKNPDRVALMARRFSPARCALLEPGVQVECEGRDVRSTGARRLTRSGGIRGFDR